MPAASAAVQTAPSWKLASAFPRNSAAVVEILQREDLDDEAGLFDAQP